MLAFIVQARTGSTRLPNKILLPFYEGKTIFDLLLEKLSCIKDVKIIVATSDTPENDIIAKICGRHNIACFRGAETNVLQRFIDAAEAYNVDKIIRVCADNPFLSLSEINRLINVVKTSDADYVSFDVCGVPSIKTHYGFWTEYVTLNALRKVNKMTKESIYLEHVTNFIYTNPNSFNIKWIDVPEIITKNRNIRLTIDTIEDFEVAREIYSHLPMDISLENVIKYITSFPDIIQSMQLQINQNSK